MTPDFLDSIQPQVKVINDMYEAAFQEGRRSAFREMRDDIDKLLTQFCELHPDFKKTSVPSLNNRQ